MERPRTDPPGGVLDLVCQSVAGPILCATSTTPCRRSPRTNTSSTLLWCASSSRPCGSGSTARSRPGAGVWLIEPLFLGLLADRPIGFRRLPGAGGRSRGWVAGSASGSLSGRRSRALTVQPGCAAGCREPVTTTSPWGLVGLYEGKPDEELLPPRGRSARARTATPLSPGGPLRSCSAANDVHRSSAPTSAVTSVSIQPARQRHPLLSCTTPTTRRPEEAPPVSDTSYVNRPSVTLDSSVTKSHHLRRFEVRARQSREA